MSPRQGVRLALVLLPSVGSWTALSAQTGCPAPVPWRIAELDQRFGLAPLEAADAVRQAGMLWSAAAGNPFLFPQSDEGTPIWFVYDHRQEQSNERRRRESELEAEGTRVVEAEAQLNRMVDELGRHREVIGILEEDFQGRLVEHNRTVEEWNQRGGAPPAEIIRIAEAQEALDRERVQLEGRTQTLNDLVSQVNLETERVNQTISDLNRARDEFRNEPAALAEVPAEYRETRRTLGPLVVSRTQEIRLFTFESRDDLVVILARQLGYALGLESSGVEGAVMAPDTRPSPGSGPPRLDPSDEAAVRALCQGR